MVSEPEVADWFGGAQRIVFVHAHPDDESIFTGGTLAGLAHTGRDVSVLTLTRGERGEVIPREWQHLEGSERLAGHRTRELQRALRKLGVQQAAFLGGAPARAEGKPDRQYRDSGMQWGADGRAEAVPDADDLSLARAELPEVVADVIAFASATRAEALVTYDEDGGYGHPDHVVAHRASREAANELGLPLWSVVSDLSAESEPSSQRIALAVDRWLDRKRAALEQHTSQLTVEGNVFLLSGGQRYEISVREFFVRRSQ